MHRSARPRAVDPPVGLGASPWTLRSDPRVRRLLAPARSARRWLVPRSGPAWTFGQAADAVLSLASFIHRRVPPGGRVAIWSQNRPEWILADLAVAAAGCTSVPILPGLHPEDGRYILEHAEVQLAFTDDHESARELDVLGIPTVGFGLEWDEPWIRFEYALGEAKRPPTLPARAATLIYTSGSTGRPKGVLHGPRTLVEAARVGAARLELDASDRLLSYLPLAHVFERWAVLGMSLEVGCEIHFGETDLLEDLLRVRPTRLHTVPRLLKRLYDSLPDRDLGRGGLDRVRTALVGAAPTPRHLYDAFRELGLPLLEGYGMTENFAHSHLDLPNHPCPGTVGPSLPGVRCRVVDGEVQVNSSGIMLGYHRNPDATAEAFTEDGWFRTGDAGELDAQGRLRLTGRISDPFKTSRGKWVDPVKLEARLEEWPETSSPCVFGHGYRQPAAVLIVDPRTAPHDLLERLNERRQFLNQSIPKHERLAWIGLRTTPWSVADRTLTPTRKLRRAEVSAHIQLDLPDEGVRWLTSDA